MKKNVFALALAALLVVFNLRVEAQQSRIYRVGVLGPEKLEDRLQIKGLRAGLRDAGYIENKNLELNIPNVKIYDELRSIVKTYL